MLTPEKIAALLADRNIAVIAQETGIGQRVLYRIRRKPEAMLASDASRLASYFDRQMLDVGYRLVPVAEKA